MLTINSLSFSFKHRPLFQNLTFKITDGQIIHLTGENGAGKSTFMSVVAGFRTPTSGEIQYHLDGQEVDNRKTYIEYLSAEANGLYTKMDAMQNLHFWSSLRGIDIDETTMIKELDAWGLGHSLVRQGFAVEKYSTGMRRRLALARVHLSSTKLWLLDEPIYGLDAKGIESFRSMLKEHQSKGGSCLIISHDTAPLQGLVNETINLKGRAS